MTLRISAAAAVLVSAAVHLLMWLDWARSEDLLGPAFLLNAVGGGVIVLLLLSWRHWLPGLLAAGFGLSTLAAFVLATTVGFFGTTATWDGWEVWTTAAAEVVAIIAGALMVITGTRSRGESEHHAPLKGAHLH